MNHIKNKMSDPENIKEKHADENTPLNQEEEKSVSTKKKKNDDEDEDEKMCTYCCCKCCHCSKKLH